MRLPDLAPETLDRIYTRAKAATLGPYKACGDNGAEDSCACNTVGDGHLPVLMALDEHDDETGGDGVSLNQAGANARYFASVSPDVVLAMVEEIRMHREYRAKVTEGLVACKRELDHLTREMER